MKQFFLVVFCMGVALVGHAQTLRVTDAETGKPLELVTVASNAPSVFVTTDENGQADVSGFVGATEIQCRLIGYEPRFISYYQLEKVDFRLQMEPSGISLDQVVVSATRWNQADREVPAKISSITRRDVALQNPQTAADMLGISGEVFIQKSQQGGGSPMIRGFSTNRLLYTVDGVRMNTAIFRSGNLQNVISLDPFAIERTEVLFGAGSVIYGSDAIGGVMSFQTLTPEFSLSEDTDVSGTFAARYASANEEVTGHLDVKVGWKKWAMVTSFSSNRYGDLRMGRFGPEEYLRPTYVQTIDGVDVQVQNEDPLVQRPTGFDQINLMQKVRFQPSEQWDIQYGFHYSTTTDYARYDRHIRFRDGLPRSAEWDYGPQVWMMNLLRVRHSQGNVLYDQADLRVAYQRFEESRISRDFNDPIRIGRFEEVGAFSANLDFLKTIGERTTLYYGLEWILNDVVSFGEAEDVFTGIQSKAPARYPESTWQSYAAYLTAQIKLSEQLMIQAGGRYNSFALETDFSNNLDFFPFPQSSATINNGAATGSLGLVITPNAQWVIGTQVSTGFRAPNVDDVGKVFDSEPGTVVVPNPQLEAEYAYNAEIGVAHIIGNTVKLDLTAYYTILDNAMVRRGFTLNGQDSILYDGELSEVQAVQNAARANVYGLQGGIEVKIPGGIGFSTVINYQVGEEELADGSISPSRHAAPWFGVSRVNLKTGKLFLQFYAMYSGERPFAEMPFEEARKDFLYAQDEDGNPYAPGWLTLNLKAQYALTEVWSVSAGVENLTDLRYLPYSSGLVAPGRNVILAVRANF
jgi:hemoglobin/transferrin/lactoferrin receptor protein